MDVHTAYSPYGYVVEKIVNVANGGLKDLGVKVDKCDLRKAPQEHGDIALLTFRISKAIGRNPVEFARELCQNIRKELLSTGLFTEITSIGGYVNFCINTGELAGIAYSIVKRMGEDYGVNPAGKSLNIIVEHTSANPVHPLHIGHLRNCLLGNALANLLKARGHKVSERFFINDAGLQVAYAAYGYSLVRELVNKYSDVKPDHLVGLIYSMTYAMVEVIRLKREIERAKQAGEDVSALNSKLSEWTWTLNELMSKNKELFEKLWEKISKVKDPLLEIQKLNREYEAGREPVVRLVREMVELCLRGFEETLERLGIRFDGWDWESEITLWSGMVDNVLSNLRKTGYVYVKDGALVFAANEVATDHVRKELGIPPNYEVLPLTLTRSDGTTLYPTRDIAYSIWKLQRADRVINVIAVQQTLAQTQLRLALYALGMREGAKNLIHYSYEMVRLPGVKMSGRRGRFVSADELLDEAVERASVEIKKRRGVTDPQVAESVGIGAVKYAMLSVSPNKVIVFDWNRILDFTQNSGPFIQYAYVRAKSILRKAGDIGLKPEMFANALGAEEKPLVILVSEFPECVAKAADELRPDYIAVFLNDLAKEFNHYYDHVPVLKAENEAIAKSRLALVEMVAITLHNGMGLLGITPPERM